jgi:universal stress protein A
MTTIAKILVPVDFSRASKAALEYAVALAKAFRSTITIFHVYETPAIMNSIVPGADNAVDAEHARAVAQKLIDGLRTAARDNSDDVDIEVAAEIEYGSPAQEILSFSRKGSFDVIVMSTHGRTGVKRALMGSVAESVVRRSPCPVLTIHLPTIGGAS